MSREYEGFAIKSRIPPSPPDIYIKALIIQGFFVACNFQYAIQYAIERSLSCYAFGQSWTLRKRFLQLHRCNGPSALMQVRLCWPTFLLVF